MPKPETLVKSFCASVIDPKIKAGGLSFTVPATGVVLFYAGPSPDAITAVREKRKDPSFSPEPNWKIAAQEAKRLGANRIDDTGIFPYMMSMALEKDLKLFTGSAFSMAMIKFVWDYVSEIFSKTTPFREAATIVCGADAFSSFRSQEMLGMLDNPSLDSVNKRDAALFRDFRKLGAKEVFVLSCATYLMELRAYIKASNDNAAKALYKNERDFFLAWRGEEKAAFRAKSKRTRLSFKKARKEVLANHKSGASRPLPPSAPAIPALASKAP